MRALDGATNQRIQNEVGSAALLHESAPQKDVRYGLCQEHHIHVQASTACPCLLMPRCQTIYQKQTCTPKMYASVVTRASSQLSCCKCNNKEAGWTGRQQSVACMAARGNAHSTFATFFPAHCLTKLLQKIHSVAGANVKAN